MGEQGQEESRNLELGSGQPPAIQISGTESVSARGRDPASVQDLSWEPGKEGTGELVGREGLQETCTIGLSVPFSLPFSLISQSNDCEGGLMSETTEAYLDLCKSSFKELAEFTHFL